MSRKSNDIAANRSYHESSGNREIDEENYRIVPIREGLFVLEYDSEYIIYPGDDH